MLKRDDAFICPDEYATSVGYLLLLLPTHLVTGQTAFLMASMATGHPLSLESLFGLLDGC